MRYSTVDNFPELRNFCNNNCIMFTLYVRKHGRRDFIFDKPFYSKYTYTICESEFVRLWIPGLEREIIDKLKDNFCIHDSAAVEESKRSSDAELWALYNKPLKDDSEHKRMKDYYSGQMFADWVTRLTSMEEKPMRPRLRIKNVIFNDPATIVFWYDGSKTVVKCQEGDAFDPEKGLAMAICKKILGSNDSQSNFNDIFKKWLPKEEEKKEPEVVGKIKNMRMTEAGLVVEAEITDAEFAPRINEILGILGE